jgi:hypothetical protein
MKSHVKLGIAVCTVAVAYFGYRETFEKQALINERRERQAQVADRLIDIAERRQQARKEHIGKRMCELANVSGPSAKLIEKRADDNDE